MHPQNGWLAPLGAFALPALQQSLWIASSIQRSGQRAQCNKQTNICNNHPYFANILHYYMVECPHLPMNKSISVTFQSNSPQSTHNITLLPFQVEECGFGEDIWAKKGLPAADSYGRVSPKQSPRCSTDSSVCRHDPCSPALNYHYALAAAQISDFLKLHWRAGRGKGSVRTSSGIRLHGQLAICSLAVLTLPRKADQTWEGLLWI